MMALPFSRIEAVEIKLFACHIFWAASEAPARLVQASSKRRKMNLLCLPDLHFFVQHLRCDLWDGSAFFNVSSRREMKMFVVTLQCIFGR